MSAWSELLAYARRGEEWVEGNLEHEAVLLARKMHEERLKQGDATAEAAPVDVPAG